MNISTKYLQETAKRRIEITRITEKGSLMFNALVNTKTKLDLWLPTIYPLIVYDSIRKKVR